MRQLTRAEWQQLQSQMDITPPIAEADGVSGEHLYLIGLLNRLGFNPMSKQEALSLAERLLQLGWTE